MKNNNFYMGASPKVAKLTEGTTRAIKWISPTAEAAAVANGEIRESTRSGPNMTRGKKTMKETREEPRLSGGKPTGTQAYPKETRTASVGGATRSVTSPGTAPTWSTTPSDGTRGSPGTTPYLPSKGKGLFKATQAREGANSIGKGPEEGPDTKGDRGRTPPKTPASGTMWLGSSVEPRLNALDASRWAIL